MSGDPPHQENNSKSCFAQSEREYILREVTMPCHRLERRGSCHCRVWGILPAAVAGEASLWLVRQFEVSGDYANVRVNTG